MQEAVVNGQMISAGPDSPEKAQCPVCGGTVTKRKRRRMDGSVSWFYRHIHGEGKGCSLRYYPVSTEH